MDLCNAFHSMRQIRTASGAMVLQKQNHTLRLSDKKKEGSPYAAFSIKKANNVLKMRHRRTAQVVSAKPIDCAPKHEICVCEQSTHPKWLKENTSKILKTGSTAGPDKNWKPI